MVSLNESMVILIFIDDIKKWKCEGVRGVWMSLPVSAFYLVPLCRELGFQLHHCDAEEDRLMMNLWLVDNLVSTMPRYTSHTVGVAGK